MKRKMPERLQLIHLAVFFVLAIVVAVSPVRAQIEDKLDLPGRRSAAMAYSTRWNSRVRLGNDLSAISNSAFTVMARFMPIYRAPHFGAVIGLRGQNGDFAIGQWIVTSESPTQATPALGMIVGGTQKQFAAAKTLRIGEWNYLAVVFKPSQGWTAYLNGVEMGSVPVSEFRAKGELSAGRISPNDKASQFYGMIDDVAVFDTALSPARIKFYGELNSFKGTEPGLKWGWRFDAGGDGMNQQSKTPVIEGNALKIKVSASRSPSDATKMPNPVQTATYQLPFPVNAEYYVVQGNSGNSHHWGPWAFTWDFIYAGKRSDPLSVRKANGNFTATDAINKKDGPGQPLTSIARGRVVHANWKFIEGDGSKIPNATIVRHAPGEYSAYFHMQQNSFPSLFPWTKQAFTIKPADFAAIDGGSVPPIYPAIDGGQPVGGLGGTGMEKCTVCFHLHFGVLDQPDLIGIFNDRITRPIHFAAFESSPDRINWTVTSGIPKEGTFVRRLVPIKIPIK